MTSGKKKLESWLKRRLTHKEHRGTPGSLALVSPVSICNNHMFKKDIQPLLKLSLHLLSTQHTLESK